MTRSTRPWWRHPALWWAAGLVALRTAAVLAFRRGDPRVLDTIRRFNKRRLNPAMLHLAGRRHWYAARLEHVGRRSGRPYATPVVARLVPGGYAVPLPYGTGVDWLRNLRASGHGWLTVGGQRHPVSDPRVVPTEELAAELDPLYRRMSRLYGIRSWLVLAAEPATDEQRAAAGAGRSLAAVSG
jgi:deazaflavin-dependent oxidoreductase (nitroreductase family)